MPDLNTKIDAQNPTEQKHAIGLDNKIGKQIGPTEPHVINAFGFGNGYNQVLHPTQKFYTQLKNFIPNWTAFYYKYQMLHTKVVT